MGTRGGTGKRRTAVPYEVLKRTFIRAVGFGALLSCWVAAALIPIQGCFDNGTCVSMSILHSKAGFSAYWNWDYRWGWRIVLVATGVAAVRTAFAVTSHSNRSADA